MSVSGYIAVDLDGTLAHYDGWRGIDHIGDPVPAMLARVKEWLDQGMAVKIFTARAYVPDPEIIEHIHKWCEKHELPRLEVTCVKDFGMIHLYDDRATGVEMNTGKLLSSSPY